MPELPPIPSINTAAVGPHDKTVEAESSKSTLFGPQSLGALLSPPLLPSLPPSLAPSAEPSLSPVDMDSTSAGTKLTLADISQPPPLQELSISPSTTPAGRSSPEIAHLVINVNSVDDSEAKLRVQTIVRDKDVDSLRGLAGGAEKVASIFGSHIETGLSTWPPQPQGSKAVHPRSLFHFLLKACNNYTIYLLLISAFMCFITNMIEQGPEIGWVDGAFIMANIFCLVTIPSVVNLCRARKAISKLLEKIESEMLNVVRDGKSQRVDIFDVLEGELVKLSKGDVVPGDGLLVRGNGLVLDEVLDRHVDCNRHPFLFSGSRVVDGDGDMIVTSVGSTNIELMDLLTSDVPEETLFQARIEELNTYADYIALGTSIVITFVSFLRFFYTKHSNENGDVDDQLPQWKAGQVSVHAMMKIFEGIFLRKQGMIPTLTSSLTVAVLGLQNLVPFTISASLSYWSRKMMASSMINAKKLSAIGTIGLATVLCIDVSKGLLVDFDNNPCLEVVETLQRDGVSIKFVSRDDVEDVRTMVQQLGINTVSNEVVVYGDTFEKLMDERVEKLDRVAMLCSPQPKHNHLMVKALKKKGDVVVYFGGLTTGDVSALKEADVGVSMENKSTQMARARSSIVVPSDKGLISLVQILKFGRVVYGKIQKFILLVHTASISGLLITLFTTICFGESPITASQLMWVNLIICILGGLMMNMDLPFLEPMTHEDETLTKRTKSLMTKVMWRNFICQVVIQTVGFLMVSQFMGRAIPGMNQNEQKAILFNTFTLYQVFQIFIAVKLAKKEVFKVVLQNQNYWFLVALGVFIGSQVLVVDYGTSLANYMSLDGGKWVLCFLFVLLLWGLDWVLQFISALIAKSSISMGSIALATISSMRTTLVFAPCLGFMCSMFVIISFSQESKIE
ncbi:unnamed protein product [Ilex paraguariensis]|uniref:Cation-transporting P-type ATPase C-terminal domain-containing protein n=1 Tax=Ilex paraguariensis TaxID=185542 RepID=A0ABC8UHJ1_9AQUA